MSEDRFIEGCLKYVEICGVYKISPVQIPGVVVGLTRLYRTLGRGSHPISFDPMISWVYSNEVNNFNVKIVPKYKRNIPDWF
jgi:hypothetical protein